MQTKLQKLSRNLLILIAFINIPAFSAPEAQSTINPETAKVLYNPAANKIDGNPEGSITLVEFFDYNCVYCRKLQPILGMLIKSNPELRIVYKEYTLFGEDSLPPTQAALAANMQGKYLNFSNALLHATNPLTQKEIIRIAKAQGLDVDQLENDMQSETIKSQIEANNALAARINISGAPVVIVTKSDIANDPENFIMQPQYVQMGFDNALVDIQTLIDKAKED